MTPILTLLLLALASNLDVLVFVWGSLVAVVDAGILGCVAAYAWARVMAE